ncbi:MAG: aminopeptidase, partial [Lachnospiraceae bacterium]|nr:aminopeptidase [Lachnospiraceae bacterium]
MIRKNTWTTYNQKQEKEAFAFAEGYKKFLDQGKTERECVDQLVNMAEEEGFVELTSLLEKKKKVKKGDKIYSLWMNKSIVLFHIGEEPMENGMNILGAHIDSPRLDVKQNPLYEEGGFAYLDTHYY